MSTFVMGEWISRRAHIEGDRIALMSKTRRLSYKDFEARTNQVANALYAAGVRPYDRVALLSLNSVEFLEIVFGVAKLGAIAVPINFRLSSQEVAYILFDSGATTLFYSSQLEEVAVTACEAEGVHVRRTISIGQPSSGASDLVASDVMAFEDFVSKGSVDPYPSQVLIDDVAMIMYTSGTTGRPKGAMLTHSNMTWNAINLLGGLDGVSHNDITVTSAPLFHIGGLGVFCLPLIYIGATNYIQESFDPNETLRLLEEFKATCLFMVPAMWAALSRVADFDSYDLSSLRFGVSGGAPCPLPVIDFFIDHSVSFLEGFGMTETSPMVSVLSSDQIRLRAGSIGRVVMHVDAKIVGEQGELLSPGVVGELCVRGPNIFKGYWGLGLATKEAIVDGWFHTGDLGKMDEEGFITLVDRKKDMIISGGENVYPIEVEQVLFRHEAIMDVAVIGVPDDKWGETVAAIVVLADGFECTSSEIIDFARSKMARYKAPTIIYFVDALPRNATGKVLKRTLRGDFTGTSSSVLR
ncbi:MULTISPECIES: long-chain fatty acid--CoA ligase [Acidithrix]|uniref:Long-chain-fatty-acid--CoA ligase n=1 Tax=Acidithrix ferrooxidans TaxID=1280514 RepID=A0A0D8HJS6_9ACTN|nr:MULTISPECIES: long-chain fatty acid--CoA ligase [Acidithrix]KJF18208.1 long-chain-fatty-acid--CoA ligase [Acidithrix ferrooxidans]CAG4899813.1 unnamed protein product [Acidithrix sp. C25]